MEAKYYNKLENQKVQCRLCPHLCIINEGYKGICRVRVNVEGTLVTHNYESFSAIHIDPIEKKPLYHFHPGREILSLGGLGCNFHCACCQNYEISQTDLLTFPRTIKMTTPEIIKSACSNPNNIGIAFTYNEPSVWFEQMMEIAIQSKESGLNNVMVSNGYINSAPLADLIGYIDAFNIDLKSFDPQTHKSFTGGEVKHVLENLVQIAKGEKHLEITFLVVPGINDSIEVFENMVSWIAENLGKNIPFHISRYFPRFRMKTGATPIQLIKELSAIAAGKLNYVYNGNLAETDYQDTKCPNCSQLVIGREGYYISKKNIGQKGECNFCGYQVVKV